MTLVQPQASPPQGSPGRPAGCAYGPRRRRAAGSARADRAAPRRNAVCAGIDGTLCGFRLATHFRGGAPTGAARPSLQNRAEHRVTRDWRNASAVNFSQNTIGLKRWRARHWNPGSTAVPADALVEHNPLDTDCSASPSSASRSAATTASAPEAPGETGGVEVDGRVS